MSYCLVIKEVGRKRASGRKSLSRDCVAYTSKSQKPYGNELPTAFKIRMCTYFSNAELLVPMRSGETPVPIPNTTVKT